MSCKGCERTTALAQLDVEELVREQLTLERDLVAEAEWQQRIQQCESCPFRAEHTCQKCGCFYKFRTALATKSCPVGRW